MTDHSTRRPATRITTDRDSTSDPITDTMGEVSHKHPYTARGAINRPFERGPTVAADGGERNAVSRTSSGRRSDGSERDAVSRTSKDERSESFGSGKNAGGEKQMKNVAHTPPHGEGAKRVFHRGGEGEEEETEE